MCGLHQEVHEGRDPSAPGADLLLTGELGGDVGHPQHPVRREQRSDAAVIARHDRVRELAAQRLELNTVSNNLKGTHHFPMCVKLAWYSSVSRYPLGRSRPSEGGCREPGDLIARHIAQMLVDRPAVPERVDELAGAVSPERVMLRLEYRRACIHGALPDRVGIVDGQVKRTVGAA